MNFVNKRKELGEWKDKIRKMAEAKKNYYMMIAKLNMNVLPDY